MLDGTSARNHLFSFGGDDLIHGDDGNDLIDAGNSEDTVYAGSGDDRIRALDGDRDVIRCGPGDDVVFADLFDATTACEQVSDTPDLSSPATPDPPLAGSSHAEGGQPVVEAWPSVARGTVVLIDRAFECRGPVDLELVKVTVHRRTMPLDAISLDQNCTGRIGRIEVDTWSGDGVKVQNAGAVAHDLVIESGLVRCYERTGEYHQDGIHVMGGRRITFRNVQVSCGRPGVNSNLFIARGGKEASIPTDILFEGGRLGPNSAQTVLLADSVRSGVRNTVICSGRHSDTRVHDTAEDPVMTNNRVLGADDPKCETQ